MSIYYNDSMPIAYSTIYIIIIAIRFWCAYQINYSYTRAAPPLYAN